MGTFNVNSKNIEQMTAGDNVSINSMQINKSSQSIDDSTFTQLVDEIRTILEEFSKTHPISTSDEKETLVAKAIESNPTLQSKVINALKTGGIEAFKEALDNPLVNTLVATIEGWRETE